MDHLARLLIVEDEAVPRERLQLVMGTPRPDWGFGPDVAGFSVDVAATAREAISRITVAEEQRSPYELVLLDLKLPLTDEDAELDNSLEANGRLVLETIRQNFSAAVVILTAYLNAENTMHAVQRGAADFLVKPINRRNEGVLFSRLVNVLGRKRELAYRESRTESLLRLKDHERKDDRERFTRIVGEKMDNICGAIDVLREYVSSKYGLDPGRDKANKMVEQLATIEATARALVQSTLTAEDDATPARFELVDIGKKMDEKVAEALPSYLYHEVSIRWTRPDEAQFRTTTFPDDLELALAELTLGALEFSPPGSAVEFSCAASEDGKDVVISVTRSGEPVPTDLKSALKDLGREEGRIDDKWRGFSFLQRLANNMGARLDIASDEKQTSIALSVPVI